MSESPYGARAEVAHARPPSAVPDVSVVIVSYNVARLVERCIESVVRQTGDVRLDVLVVDNRSTDDTISRIHAAFAHVRTIANDVNRGFPAAVNQGIAAANGRYILLLNPDTVLEPGALAEMMRALDRQPDVGVVGPRLVYPGGQTQSSRRRFPTVSIALFESTIVQSYLPTNRFVARYHLVERADAPDDLVQDVDWLVGACLLARRAAVEQVGSLDESFFMYSEEVDWCKRMRDAGWRIVYDPRAVVWHDEGKSSAQNLARRALAFNRSKVRYFGKHHGARVARIVRGGLIVLIGLQILEEAFKLALGSRPGLRRERIAAHAVLGAALLRDGIPPGHDAIRTPALSTPRQADLG